MAEHMGWLNNIRVFIADRLLALALWVHPADLTVGELALAASEPPGEEGT